MKEKLTKLIDVKSIMTLALTIVFCVLALMGAIGAAEFLSIFTMIVGFYFGTQSEKKKSQDTTPMAELAAPIQTGVVITGNTTPESTMDTLYPPDKV